MVLSCQPFYDAYESVEKLKNSASIIFTPQGKTFNQQTAKELSAKNQIIMICGHYEGYDERIRQIPELTEISIGDFILTEGN